MLLLLLWLLPSIGSTEPPQTLRKPIQACPNVGYFFERQPGPEPAACYLCYCKGDTEAVCTLRDSERCNEKNYSYHTDVEETTVRKHRRRKHRRRSRRSAGLVDLFFKESHKDQLMKSMMHTSGEECKPKSSKSIGCPPKDWCEGCLVCDCDDENQWQCHVMSFCDDKTQKPKVRKVKKDIKVIVNPENDENKETTTKTVLIKKNDKRSVKHNKNKRRKNTSSTRTTGTRKPTTKKTPKPLISVETKKAFKRKKDKNKDVLVIKKYISTLAPITSPEFLKYKNNSRKLAQILYQQYESSSKATNHVKREIKAETKVGGKMLLTHEYIKKNKVKHDTANSKNMGDKIFSMKQKPKFKLKNNARGRKPMNVREHNDRNTKMKAIKDMREKKSLNNFYSKQKELMESYENNLIEGNQNKGKNKDAKGNYERKEIIKLIGKRRRNKRDVPLTIEVTRNATNMENEIGNTTLLDRYQVSESPDRLFTNNEEITSSLNNYVYTVDNNVTSTDESNGILYNETGYETTSKYVDIITIGDIDFKTENFSHTDIVNYTNIEDELTFSHTDIENYTNTEDELTTESFTEINHDLQSLNMTNFNDSHTQEQQLTLQKNYSLETTIIVDPVHYKQSISKENLTMETTTLIEITRTGFPRNQTNLFNNSANDMKPITKNNRNITNIIKKVYAQDIDRIITGLNKCKLRKLIKTNKSKGNKNNNVTASLNSRSDNKTVKYTRTDFETMVHNFTNNSKYRSKQNRIMAIKYLKKLYSKLLSNKNNKTLLTNVAVMESICDTFGPCKISTGSVELINSKITGLISETKRALSIISIIKGLLESLESGNTGNYITGSTTEEVEFKGYVKKLNAILTDNYATPLNETQMTQMKIIKNNTKVFIRSIGKFAFILNDILKIIHSDKTKYESMKRGKILLNRVTRQKEDSEPLHKIKKLFVKFNMLQNSFMRNMYQAISDLEMQNNLNAMAVEQSKSEPRNGRYKMSVNKYMNKISYNLGKLKELALKMGARERIKRSVMRDDDAVEYLLTLMEYLLKKNNPLDSPPVTDGIDLLIDAIRRAPDIKPIKKKVLHHAITTPTYFVKEISKSSSESVEENISFFKNHSENFKDMSFEKAFYNETQILQSNTESDIEEYKPTTNVPQKVFIAVTTTKYVDVEDIVFNGDEIQKVYIATFPPNENTEDPYFVKETPKAAKKKKLKSAKPYALPSDANEENTLILSNATDAETQMKKEMYTPIVKSNVKTQFDLLNEEYEKRLKVKSPTTKTVKIKHKKQKRPRKKQKVTVKTDVSSISKEVDEERTRKKVAAEEAMLRKHMLNSIDYDPFKSMGDDSVSRDLSPLDGRNSEAFPSFFT